MTSRKISVPGTGAETHGRCRPSGGADTAVVSPAQTEGSWAARILRRKGQSVHTSNFLGFVRGHAARIFAEAGGPFEFCSALATDTSQTETALRAQQLLPPARDQRDYAIATAYALLIGRERRK